MWMKIDPNQEFLKIISIIQEEHIWLLQLCEEKDFIGSYFAL
jgi:hypothetical protein